MPKHRNVHDSKGKAGSDCRTTWFKLIVSPIKHLAAQAFCGTLNTIMLLSPCPALNVLRAQCTKRWHEEIAKKNLYQRIIKTPPRSSWLLSRMRTSSYSDGSNFPVTYSYILNKVCFSHMRLIYLSSSYISNPIISVCILDTICYFLSYSHNILVGLQKPIITAILFGTLLSKLKTASCMDR